MVRMIQQPAVLEQEQEMGLQSGTEEPYLAINLCEQVGINCFLYLVYNVEPWLGHAGFEAARE